METEAQQSSESDAQSKGAGLGQGPSSAHPPSCFTGRQTWSQRVLGSDYCATPGEPLPYLPGPVSLLRSDVRIRTTESTHWSHLFPSVRSQCALSPCFVPGDQPNRPCLGAEAQACPALSGVSTWDTRAKTWVRAWEGARAGAQPARSPSRTLPPASGLPTFLPHDHHPHSTDEETAAQKGSRAHPQSGRS